VADEDANYVQGLGMNLVKGVVGTFVVFTGVCLIVLRNLDQAILCTSASTIFGGPYMGFLLAIRGAQARDRRSEREAKVGSESDSGNLDMSASLDALGPGERAPMIRPVIVDATSDLEPAALRTVEVTTVPHAKQLWEPA